MQEHSAVECSQGERLKKLRSRLQVEWADLGKQIGISASMCYQVARGVKNLSDLALFRLEQAESKAGISLPSPPSQTPASEPEGTPIKNYTISGMGSEKGIDREELRQTIDELKRLLGDLERIYKRK